MRPLHFRHQKREEARLRCAVGNGLSYRYHLNGIEGRLLLKLLPHIPSQAFTESLACDLGTLHLSEPVAVCSLLSDCPLLTPAQAEEIWYWPIFNQSLSDEVRELLGSLLWRPESRPIYDGMWLSISIRLGEDLAHSLLYLSIETLSSLLDHAGWRPSALMRMDHLPLKLPFILGTLSLSLAQLRHLKSADVVLPTTTFISLKGDGLISLSSTLFKGMLVNDHGNSAHFYITDMETSNVNSTPDDYPINEQSYPIEHNDDKALDEPQMFDSLPLALTLRCGHLKLTLGELNRLCVGSTLVVEHVKPGEAILCHGDFPLAKGELVDVQGQLGLQITHVLPGAVNPLGNNR